MPFDITSMFVLGVHQ